MTGFDWHQPAVDFCDLYGIPHEVVEAAADNPKTVGLNEDSGKEGYVIEDRRRGDVTAVVGLRDERPAILYVVIHTDQDITGLHRTAGGGHKEAPKTWRGVRARIIADGFTIRAGRYKDLVCSPDGEVLMGYDPTKPHTEAWGHYRRMRDKYRIGQRVGLGDLLTQWGGEA